MKELNGKVAVVTGAASGIGHAMARRFALEGMKVALADVEEGPLSAAVADVQGLGVDAIGVITDVSSADSVDALAATVTREFGTAHVVCNNAGVGGFGVYSWELPLTAWEWVLGVNVYGVIHGMRSFVPMMLEQGEGHIVNTASVAAFAGGLGSTAYTASKHAVLALSDSLRAELALVGAPVKVSVLCPGRISTGIANAERNWPDRLGSMPAPREEDKLGPFPLPPVLREMFAEPMEPAVVADLVLDAVQSDRFWVLTHPEVVYELLEQRSNEIHEKDV